MEDTYCIICCKESENITSVPKYQNGTSVEDKKNSRCEMMTFLMKYLKIPDEMLPQLFQDFKKSDSWLHLCRICSKRIEKAQCIQDQIIVLKKQFVLLQNEIKELITSSEDKWQRLRVKNRRKQSIFQLETSDVNPFEKIRWFVIQDNKLSENNNIKAEELDFEEENSFPDGDLCLEDPFEDFKDDLRYKTLEMYPSQSFPEKSIELIFDEIEQKAKSNEIFKASQERECKTSSCNKCGETFSRKSKLNTHMKSCEAEYSKNKVPKRKANSPGRKSRKKHSLTKKELIKAAKPENFICEDEDSKNCHFQCDKCEKSYNFKESLKRHYKTHHPDEAQPNFPRKNQSQYNQTVSFCEICQKAFQNHRTLKFHYKGKHPEEAKTKYPLAKPLERLKCPLCDYQTFLSKSMTTHARMHSGEKPFTCDICGENFSTKAYLRYHQQRKHYKELDLDPFKCEVCGKFYESPTSLKLHVQTIHEKKFTIFCQVCNKGFTRQSLLAVHVKRHTGEKTELCAECGTAFVTKCQLKLHTMRVHTGERPHQCKFCPKKFAESTKLKRHVKSLHPEQIEQEIL